MKCISLWQPWASAIAWELKRIETRSWRPPDNLIGQRIAIHAAKRWTAAERDAYAALCPPGLPMPLGCIVACATLAEVCRTEFMADRITAQEKSFGDYTPGRFAWMLTGITRLVTPVPVRGRQGFFDVAPPAEVGSNP